MRPLSSSMAEALLVAPAFELGLRRRTSVREGTAIALEERGLVETRVERAGHALDVHLWRRTPAGDELARVVAERKRAAGDPAGGSALAMVRRAAA